MVITVSVLKNYHCVRRYINIVVDDVALMYNVVVNSTAAAASPLLFRRYRRISRTATDDE